MINTERETVAIMKCFVIVLLALTLLQIPTEIYGDAAIQCPNVKLKFPFELSQFLGVWYEIARFSRPAPTPRPGVPHLTLRPMLTACVRLTFSLKDNGQLRVERSGLDANGKLQVQVGEAAQGHAEHARLFFKYPGEYEEDLGVVEADYEDHALLYGCHLTSTGHVSQNAWILARDQTLDEDTTQILKAVLSSRHVDISQFTFTRQDDKCQQQNPDNATIITLPGDIGV